MSFIGELLGFELDAPSPDPMQTALTQMAYQQAVRAQREGEELTPFVLASMGLTTGDDGNLRDMTFDEFSSSLDPIAQREFQNINTTFDRISQAQAGEKSELLKQEEEKTLGLIAENRARQGGNITGDNLLTATGKTTADIQTLEAQQRIAALRGDEERRAFETQLQGVNQNNIGIFRNNLSNKVTQQSAFPQRRNATLSGIASAQQPGQFQQGLNFQADAFGAGNRSGLTGMVTAITGAGILKALT